jgi:hypothetical protein
MSVVAMEPEQVKAPAPAVVFSGKGTLLVGLVVGIFSLHLQTCVTLGVLVYEIVGGGQRQLSSLLKNLESHGTGMTLALLAGAAITTAVLVLCVRLRTADWSDYLGLKPVGIVALVVSMVTMVAFTMGMDYFVSWLEVDSSSDVMINLYKTANWKPLVWVALIVGAPVYEEIFMRGFLFAGWQKSLTTHGAIVAISLIWTFMHVQYGPVQWSIIFTMGIVLGYARAWTGSLYAPIAMHALNNTMATIELIRHTG